MRYEGLDVWRGVTIGSMVAYHGLWDLVYLLGMDVPWFEGLAGMVWQQSIAWSFIFISGFCLPLGRRPLRRGLELLAWSGVVSAVTHLAMHGEGIYFGVLSLLGSAMVLGWALERPLTGIPPAWGAAVSFLLFVLLYPLQEGRIGIGPYAAEVPPALYDGMGATFLGFKDGSFFSLDYFPLFPWFFLFLTGYFCCRRMEQAGRLALLAGPRWRIGCIGRQALPVYLLHQPLLYGACFAWESLWEVFLC